MSNKKPKPITHISDQKRAIQRYANLTGGMIGRSMSSEDGLLLTLDNAYIRGTQVIFAFNAVMEQKIGMPTIMYKFQFKLTNLLFSTNLMLNFPDTYNMLLKLKHYLEPQ